MTFKMIDKKYISCLTAFSTLNFASYVMKRNLQKRVNRTAMLLINNKINTTQHIHSDARLELMYKVIRKSTDTHSTAISHSTLKSMLQKCESVPEQIDVFHSYVKLTNEDIDNRILMCKQIESVFKHVFPCSSVQLIGSSPTGLGRKGSDLDLTFQLFNNDEVLQNNTNANFISNSEEKKDEITSTEFMSLSIKKQLLFLKELLVKSEIGESFKIIPGRCPLLNFVYDGLICDLSIKNRTASHATNLMRICEKLDYRVAPLFHLIIYWGKHSNLVGGLYKFKSYGIFLMLIYFLQTRQPPILPNVEDIFLKTEILKNEDNCLYDISQCIRKFQQSENSESLEILLREFFFFYGNFDFSSIICVMKGNLCDRQTFVLQNPDFEVNTISIQDPFRLNWNVTTSVNWKHNKLFIKALLSICEAYHGRSYNSISGENWGLIAVLESSYNNSSFVFKECIEMEISLKKVLNSVDNLEKSWNIAAESIFRLLREGLMFECKKLESIRTGSAHLPKNDSANGAHSEYSNCSVSDNATNSDAKYIYISSAMCIAADTWLGRNNYVQNFCADETTFLQNEQEISLRILKNKTMEDKKFHFLCECIGVHKNSESYLLVNLKPKNRDTFLPKLGIVLKEYILKYSLKYL